MLSSIKIRKQRGKKRQTTTINNMGINVVKRKLYILLKGNEITYLGAF